MEYPKINSLWKRQGWYFDEGKKKSPAYQEGRQSFIEGDYASPEFPNVRNWRVTEKIDGTNIRIYFFNTYMDNSLCSVSWQGRTNKAQIPEHLNTYIAEYFTIERLRLAFPEAGNYTLYGEGYGPKIQAVGGNYRKDVGFILFDAKVGNWWLKYDDLVGISEQLEIPIVPDLGIMTELEAVNFVKSMPLSRVSRIPQVMEGIVCRSEPLMLFRRGDPLMWKLKTKEFV